MGSQAYAAVFAELDRRWSEQASRAFRAALERLRLLAENGDLEACEFLAEILSTSALHRDVVAAYKWYYIALSQQGYRVAFQDLNSTPPSYRGPDGDFRNEAQVSELVSELGFARVQELDREAEHG